ncbi:precorrin-6A synthase (deacetylating) [Nocardioides sp. MAH-18]|uniref:Precorrin-6A synthase (Deacetylating) n=1 Tax=Nocardioides agri TaxID=2682843 RepID=A0A6L6XZE1_9ACTN|nr:SAM-dependent methyltransferase [Nocardioides sp. CGMCC 1.13656]MBA2952931.1 precorrin-6A synthase (deacetylating) [Nocardioides sp. CGMCC 1.13656]MVQ52093.1 precorrin-6A synthase (deacetylating) [Nocardioides sp. MAH-18]
MESRRVRVIGVGPGDPEQVTLAAVEAMRSVDYFIVTDRSSCGGMPDPLVTARDRLLDRHLTRPPTIVRIEDPDAVPEAMATALRSRSGVAGLLVWGDPAFYDSTIPILRSLPGLDVEMDVVPGISAVQLLAARHRLVLHEVGEPLHLTSGRALAAAVAQGQENVVVMLNRVIDLPGLDDWSIWWGANLGTAHEELVAGRVATVLPDIHTARNRVAERAGWIMDIFLLRREA